MSKEDEEEEKETSEAQHEDAPCATQDMSMGYGEVVCVCVCVCLCVSLSLFLYLSWDKYLTCDVPFPPRRTGRFRKGMISARPSYQVVKSSGWDPETFAPGRRHVPRGAPSLGSG